jgi:hypothetical protein
MRFRLRTLLILLAIGPPLIAAVVYAVLFIRVTYLWFYPPPGGWSG